MNTATDIISDITTLLNDIRLLDAMQRDIQAAGPGTHGAHSAQVKMDKVTKRVAALQRLVDDTHTDLTAIGRHVRRVAS